MYAIRRTFNEMGFREIQRQAIKALQAGRIQHEARGEIDEKNLLLMGDVTTEQAILLLNACRGTQYSSSPHHAVPEPAGTCFQT